MIPVKIGKSEGEVRYMRPLTSDEQEEQLLSPLQEICELNDYNYEYLLAQYLLNSTYFSASNISSLKKTNLPDKRKINQDDL